MRARTQVYDGANGCAPTAPPVRTGATNISSEKGSKYIYLKTDNYLYIAGEILIFIDLLILIGSVRRRGGRGEGRL